MWVHNFLANIRTRCHYICWLVSNNRLIFSCAVNGPDVHLLLFLPSNNLLGVMLSENTKDDGPLDFPITDEELKQGMYILKRGKASGYDSVSYEMISCVL